MELKGNEVNSYIPYDGNLRGFQVGAWDTDNVYNLVGNATGSTSFSGYSTSKIVRLIPTADCYISFGVNAVANSTTSTRILGDMDFYVHLIEGHKIAIYGAATLNITPIL
jgi:hypothetical protein